MLTQLQILQVEEDFKIDQAHSQWISVWESSCQEHSTKTAKILPEQTRLRNKPPPKQKQLKLQLQKKRPRQLQMLRTQLKMQSMMLGLPL
jgi:hypothetical protein